MDSSSAIENPDSAIADAGAATDSLRVVPLDEKYHQACLEILNQIIDEGLAFPWDRPFDSKDFAAKYYSGQPGEQVWCVVDASDQPLGFVHIRPNNEGRCGHVANCGYSVRADARGRGVGRLLVQKSLQAARDMGYRGLQFNAVVATNTAAIALYQSFGFHVVGTIPGGFRQGGAESPDYVDMHIMYRSLVG